MKTKGMMYYEYEGESLYQLVFMSDSLSTPITTRHRGKTLYTGLEERERQ